MIRSIRAFEFIVLAVALVLVTAGVVTPKAEAAIGVVSASPNPIIYPSASVITVNAAESDAGNGPISLNVNIGTLAFSSCQTPGPAACPPSVSGSGTASMTLSSATDGDGTPGEALIAFFTYSPPSVAFAQVVNVSACQGSGCSPVIVTTITVFPSGTILTTEIFMSASTPSLNCGASVTVTASVFSSGAPVGNGTPVSFNTNAGHATILTTTSGGVATAIFVAPIGLSGGLLVTATSGPFAASITIIVSCDVAGPPASIALIITPSSITCGSTASILATVRDRFGSIVASGTRVNYSTDRGSINPTAPTILGHATGVLTSFPNNPGLATITVTSGDARATGTVNVTCAAAATATQPPPATQIPPVVATATAPVTGILPPSTGDGGLR